RIIALAEPLDVARGWRSDQPSVERIRPGVIGTLDGLGEPAAGLLAEPGAAVAADVVVGPDGAGPVAEEDNAFLPDGLEKIVPRVADPVLPPHAEPPSGKDPLRFLGKDLRGDIVAPGQRSGAVNRDLRGLEKLRH